MGRNVPSGVRVFISGLTSTRLRNNTLYTNAFFLTADVVTVSALGLAFWVLAARIYTPGQVGLASATVAVVSLIARSSRLGFDFGLVRFLAGSGEKAVVMVNSCFTIAGFTALAAALIFIAGLRVWSPALIYLHNPALVIFFTLLTVAYAVFLLTEQSFIAQRLARYILYKNTFTGLVKIAAVAVFFYILNSTGILAAWGFAVFAGLAVALFLFLPRALPGYLPFPSVDRKIISEIFRFSIGNYIADLLWQAPFLLFPLIVINTLGAEMSAYFYIPWAITQMLFAVPMAVASSLFAEGSYDEAFLKTGVMKSLKLALCILIPVVAVLVIFSGQVLLLFGDTYSESGAAVLRILAFSAFPVGITYISMSVMRVLKKTGWLVMLSASVTSVSLASGYIFMKDYGLSGIGFSWLAVQTLAAVVVASSLLFGYYRNTRVSDQAMRE